MTAFGCRFGIGFEVQEGEELYVVAVGRRGEMEFTFEELRDHGVELSLGP